MAATAQQFASFTDEEDDDIDCATTLCSNTSNTREHVGAKSYVRARTALQVEHASIELYSVSLCGYLALLNKVADEATRS